MSRSDPPADEIVERLMDLMVGLKRRARSGYDGQTLPYPQHAVLKWLEKGGPATTADLARAELITPQAMGGLVATLEEAGYLARRDDAEDARRRLVTLTAAGRKILAANRAARHRWLASLVTEQFDAEERRTLAAALALLGKLFPHRKS
ncbi:MAG TPA: MarR family transcriptional regulator [Polyangia bacterium]|nr:MarR family transcriptional regulator [Polyangia bacterium]